MSAFHSPHQPDTAPAADEGKPRDDLEAIRSLLFGQEAKQLSGIRQRLDDPALHARDLSQVLPRAITLSNAESGQLATALAPAVETALKESVRRDPSPLVSAIFPIIGPAIRKSIAETFSKLVQALNQTLDHSITAQGLKWRLEAWRGGRSFAEVVLAHTLVYRVEQVFLIHKESGVLLQHVLALNIQKEGAEMVSGLLTAIQDFARDSFRLEEGDALHTLQVGDLNVWLETSPGMTLAAVIRGHAPLDFRAVLQTALENIHREQAGALERFNGDAGAFELSRPHLESCVQERFNQPPRKTPFLRILVLALAVLLLGAWIFLNVRENRRWTGYVDRLKSEPGIMVVESGKSGGKFHVAGWRDPLAADPAVFFEAFKVDPKKVASRWEPYHALRPEIALQRAIQVLRPPATTTLRLRDGVLSAEGTASAAWIQDARQRASTVAGVQRLETSGLVDETGAEMARREREIMETVLFFEDGIGLAPGQEGLADSLASRILELQEAARRSGQVARVHVIGHTDESGTEEKNLRLSHERASFAASLLLARGVPGASLLQAGVAAREPLRKGPEEQPNSRNRRVTFRTVLEPAPMTHPAP